MSSEPTGAASPFDRQNMTVSHPPASSAAGMPADAAALIEELNTGPCHFAGLSMGGFVGMRLAIRRLGGSRLVLITDGMPTCPNGNGEQMTVPDGELALNAVQTLRSNNIETFVVGIGEEVDLEDAIRVRRQVSAR